MSEARKVVADMVAGFTTEGLDGVAVVEAMRAGIYQEVKKGNFAWENMTDDEFELHNDRMLMLAAINELKG